MLHMGVLLNDWNLCINLAGFSYVKVAGKTVFLGMSMTVFLEDINI